MSEFWERFKSFCSYCFETAKNSVRRSFVCVPFVLFASFFLPIDVFVTLGIVVAINFVGRLIADAGHVLLNYFRNHRNQNFFTYLTNVSKFDNIPTVIKINTDTKKLSDRFDDALTKLSDEDRSTFLSEAHENGYFCIINQTLMAEPCKISHSESWADKTPLTEYLNQRNVSPVDNATQMNIAEIQIDETQQQAITDFVNRVGSSTESTQEVPAVELATETSLLTLPSRP